MMMKRLGLALITSVLLIGVVVSAQTLPPDLQQFWNLLRTGGYAFATGRVQTGGYLNFGSTVGTNGYGVRDSAGTIQFKDSGGAWAAMVGAITGGTCTNQAVTAIAGSTGVPTCTTLTSAYVNNSIALTGTDINTSNQVTATHLASALPVAQGGWGLATLTAHALYVGNGTTAPTAVAVCGTGTYVRGASSADPICSTLVLPNTASAGQYLVATTSNTVIGVQPALIQQQPTNATARSSSGGTFVMMGLGADTAGSGAHPCSITPVATGRVVFEINGDLVNNTNATTISIKIAENTGGAPANNASATGTVITIAKVIDGITSDLTSAFHLVGTQTGLALGTAVWFDLQLTTSTTNTGQPTNIDCVAHEI